MKEFETAYRYAGIASGDERSRQRMKEILASMPERFPVRSVWKQVPLSWNDGQPVVDGQVLPGAMARRFLQGAEAVILMAITLGPAFDREVRKLSYINMEESLFLNSAGAAFVDARLDEVQASVETALGKHLSDRFSPGYEDLPLTMQSFMERELSLNSSLGIHLLDSCLMVPEKSVTAIAGVFEKPQPQKIRGCQVCRLYPCALAKKGDSCVR